MVQLINLKCARMRARAHTHTHIHTHTHTHERQYSGVVRLRADVFLETKLTLSCSKKSLGDELEGHAGRVHLVLSQMPGILLCWA